MRILYIITQSELGGAQKYVLDLASGLGEGYESVVAVGEQGEDGELAGKLKQSGLSFFEIRHLKRSISPVNDLRAVFELLGLIRRIKPDIIHLNSSKVSILGSIAAWLYSKSRSANPALQPAQSKPRIIYTAHGWVFSEPLPGWMRIAYKSAEKLTAPLKDMIICVSESDRQAALDEKIASPGKLITIHNGIAPVNFLEPDEARDAVISKTGRPELFRRNLRLVSIGNLYPTKGYIHGIEAVKILIRDMKADASYVIMGEGVERAMLERRIKSYGLEDRVALVGRIEDAPRLLKAFDIYVSPSVKEGLSYTLIEAMQAGLPITATGVGGNPELIDKLSGVIVPPADPGELARQILKLSNDRMKMTLLGSNARERALKDFSLQNMRKKTYEIYG